MATSLFQAPPIAPFNVEDPNNISELKHVGRERDGDGKQTR